MLGLNFYFPLAQAPIRVGGHFISTSITVLEQKSGPPFIFGLDNLKRHQVCHLGLVPAVDKCNRSTN